MEGKSYDHVHSNPFENFKNFVVKSGKPNESHVYLVIGRTLLAFLALGLSLCDDCLSFNVCGFGIISSSFAVNPPFSGSDEPSISLNSSFLIVSSSTLFFL